MYDILNINILCTSDYNLNALNYCINTYFAVADLANCTIIGLSFKIYPLVSFSA